MFLEQYKLEANPFAPDAARPVFASHSMRYALLKLEDLFSKSVQSLFLSGPAGVGKTTLSRQRLRQLKELSVTWVKPTCETREQLLAQLLEEIGPGTIEGSATELRNILEVFLRHQAGNGRLAFVVADGLERFAAPVLRELEALAQMRLRNRPIVQLLGLTRSEELVANLLPQYEGGPLARAAHQRLAGFTLDETRSYIWACLRGAGCDWAEELIPDEVVLDVQAFTQGIVGDINAICCAALTAISERSTGSNRQPKVTRALLKEAGGNLNLRYDASAWAQPVEELSPQAVHLSDPSPLRLEARAPDRVERQNGASRGDAESAAHGARPRRQLRHQPRQPLRQSVPEPIPRDARWLDADRSLQHERLLREWPTSPRASAPRRRPDRRRPSPNAL